MKTEKTEKTGWEKSFYVRPWIVFALILVVIVIGIASAVRNGNQQIKDQQSYSDCLRDQFPNGDASLCDHLK